MFTSDLVDPSDLPMLDLSHHTHRAQYHLGAVGQPSPGMNGHFRPDHSRHNSHSKFGYGTVDDQARAGEDDGSSSSVDIDLTSLIAQAQSHRQKELNQSQRHGGDSSVAGLESQLYNLSVRRGPTPEIGRRWADSRTGVPATASFGYTGNGTRYDEDAFDRTSVLSTHRATDPSPIAIQLQAPPKTAPLPTFQPFSDTPQLPPTPQPPQQVPSVDAYQQIPDRAMYTSNSSASPANGSIDYANQVTKHLEGLSTLLGPLLAQSKELDQLRQEVKMWKSEWSKAEDEIRRLTSIAAAKPQVQAGPLFSAVLIDGDGLIFQESLINQGFPGGQVAAQALLSALPTLAASATINSTASPTLKVNLGSDLTAAGDMQGAPANKELGNVIVQIFLNKSGLGTALTKTGLVSSYSKYEQFLQGLSASHELFTVCDVGPGKEATDAKIKEHLKLYAKNAQCEMIVLGATHDNGYANVLSSLQTESRLSKLLLLKGYEDLAGQLKPYASRVVSIPDLFRSTKIPPVPITFSSVVKDTTPTPAVSQKKQPTKVAETSSESTPSEGGVEIIEWSAPKKTAMEKAVTDTTQWQTTGKDQKKKSKKDKRLADAVRTLDPRPCHTFYLSPYGCKNGRDCKYGHSYDLNEAQLDELARLAKAMMCPFVLSSKGCRFSDEDCVYGHRCPNSNDCPFGDTCRFNALPNGHGELDEESE